jgi:hypothetical protein
MCGESITTEFEVHNTPVRRTKPVEQSLLLRMRTRLTRLINSLPGNVCAAITRSRGHFVVGTGNVLSLEHVTETLDHIHVHAGPRAPGLALRIKQPFM